LLETGAGWPAAGAHALIASQTEYSLVNRQAEREIIPAAQAHGMGILACSPLGRGLLTGKYRTGTPVDSRVAATAGPGAPEVTPRSRRIVDAVTTAASGLGCTPMEVALAWVRDQPGVSSVLLGARTNAQLSAAMTSVDVTLPPEIAVALAEVSETT
jgi:aryl-alcohol dehydrogenase-like predicted oxidoreductase